MNFDYLLFDSAPDFDVCDRVAITKLAVHYVDLDERKRPTMTQNVNYLQGIRFFSENFGDASLQGGLIDEWDIQSTKETAGRKKKVMQRLKGILFIHFKIKHFRTIIIPTFNLSL